ncbi:MAG: adenosylmethionine--8-amino-7-oxononanoate transaminase [Shewanella sp.]|nr:adenosylmethionine--8-amino-7-oxononanoate transaminase [Shewanella sp.]MCF1431411.1 adenosylmethionine--8-amino-7-oxononanoate transaminase [Shewanella sp.]MCF1438837.1 adenosylmethionine--8-amino-7-oxononanoate transaminase [Shewanella sp.]MCF1458905.1 adenosylmethionine--8-amino-7-oxononanoate transaminase [Shewanella sp.]
MNNSFIDYPFDQQHIWHPYTSMHHPLSVYGVASAGGCELILDDGRQLVDGTSSWWSCVHGYGHPALLEAMQTQLHTLSHVMFGGITHEPAIELAKQLIGMTPKRLTKVFYADSGSVAVEVAIKMALQYWQGRGKPQKQQIMTIKQGYHGDTFAAMSVCDPDNGMHTMFGSSVTPRLFAPAPQAGFDKGLSAQDASALRAMFEAHHQESAALILEPVMQAAGAMNFYAPEYLALVRCLCDEFDVLLIADEIATGFGRTGKLFACEHAGIEPDLMCLGKALTGGCISLAVTLCSDEVADGISSSPAGVFMHGPTFMANPLACAAARASMALLQRGDWQAQVAAIEEQMQTELAPASMLSTVTDVRVLGAVGVIEMHERVNTELMQQGFVERGVWVRPFDRYLYIMPPYCITPAQLTKLTSAMVELASSGYTGPGKPSHG